MICLNGLENSVSNGILLQSYDDIEQEIQRANPEQCIESVNVLSKAINASERKIIYYSALQGE